MERAKGPWRSEHPPGLVTGIVANSFNKAWKWLPRIPIWLRAKGIKRRVVEDWIGPEERASFLNLRDSEARRKNRSLLKRLIGTIVLVLK